MRAPVLPTGTTFTDRFDMRYCHCRRLVAARRARGRLGAGKRRHSNDPMPERAVARDAMARARGRNACVRARLQFGFRWHGGYFGGEGPLDGYRRAPFVYKGLVSNDHPILRMFVAYTPRARKGLRTGMLKSVVETGDSKLLALDQPLICWNQSMRGIIRVDIDSTFPSWNAMRAAIENANLPLPNVAVGSVDDHGRVVNPHFYWLLAAPVCWTSKGSARAIWMMRAVERGLVHALLPVGADPGGLLNPTRGKNPLCPLWSRQVMANEPYQMTDGKGSQPGIVALAPFVRLDVSLEEMHRAAAEMILPEVPLADGKKVPSNLFFSRLQRHAFDLVEAYHPRGKGQGSREDFVACLMAYASGLADRIKAPAEIEAVACRVADYAWSTFDPSRRQAARPERGAAGRSARERRLPSGGP